MMADRRTGTISPDQAEIQPFSISPVRFSGGNSNHINNLLFDIFVLIWSLVRTTPDNDRPYFPIVVSHVCRTWRCYALDVSSFWSTVDFSARMVNAEKAKLWLERSKDSPVNINIGSEPFQEASVPKVKLIMRVILPHLGRCRSLKVQGVPEKVARVIFDRLRDASAPILEALEISTEHSTKWEPKPFRDISEMAASLYSPYKAL